MVGVARGEGVVVVAVCRDGGGTVVAMKETFVLKVRYFGTRGRSRSSSSRRGLCGISIPLCTPLVHIVL